MGCSAESEVHFVEHTASCGEQRVCGDQCILLRALQVVESRGSVETSAFCGEQCKLWSAGGLGRTVLSMPP